MQTKGRQEKRMRMAYEYVRVTQYHSLFRFPHRWCYPVSVIVNQRERMLQEQNGGHCQTVIQAKFCNKFHLGGNRNCCYEELVRGKEYSTELPVNFKQLSQKDEEEGQHAQGHSKLLSIGSNQSLLSGNKLNSISAIRQNESVISANTQTMLNDSRLEPMSAS